LHCGSCVANSQCNCICRCMQRANHLYNTHMIDGSLLFCCHPAAEPGSVKRSTAPLNSHASSTPAAGPASNTATLATGLKRFGA
jgi:hypothetical protein